jgi:ligand-binding sensor domain-containing protein
MKTFIVLLSSLLIYEVSHSQTIFWEQTNGPAGGCVGVNQQVQTNNGDMFIPLCCGFGNGIYYSSDEGNSWHSMSIGLPEGNYSGVIINEAGILFTPSNGNGVYKSEDYGENWIHLPSAPSDPDGITIDPSGIIYLGTFSNGVYRSMDDGVTWEHLNSGISYARRLSVGPSGNIYAGQGGSGGIFCSEDQGITWNLIGLEGKDPMWITFDENGNLLVCTFWEGLFRSSDNGTSWEFISKGVTTTGAYYGLHCNPSGHLFLATDDGLWRSNDDGLTWAKLNSVPYERCVWSDSSGQIFFAGDEIGVFKSIDDGMSWAQTGPAISSVFSLTTFLGNRIIAGADPISSAGNYYGVFLTSDQGISWSPTGLMYKNAYSLTTSGNVIIAGTENGIYRSLDSARTWSFVGLANNVVKLVKSTSGGEIFAGIEGYGLYRSLDQGESWGFIGFPNLTVLSVASDNSGTLIAGTSDGIYFSPDNGANWAYSGLANTQILSMAINNNGTIFSGTESGIYSSNDGGTSWVFKAFLDTTVYQLLTSDGNQIFAGTNNGVYRSINNGDTWENISLGLDNLNIKALVIDSAGYLYAGVDYRGVYRSINKFVGISVHSKLSDNPIRCKVFPNPLTASTEVEYKLQENTIVILKVYNHLGQEVCTLVNERQDKGDHKVIWIAEGQSSGIFFYRLTTGSQSSTGKMVVVR